MKLIIHNSWLFHSNIKCRDGFKQIMVWTNVSVTYVSRDSSRSRSKEPNPEANGGTLNRSTSRFTARCVPPAAAVVRPGWRAEGPGPDVNHVEETMSSRLTTWKQRMGTSRASHWLSDWLEDRTPVCFPSLHNMSSHRVVVWLNTWKQRLWATTFEKRTRVRV